MSDTAIIVRLFYYLPNVDEAARAWRFEFFRANVIPRIVDQGDVWVWVHPRHEAEVQAMDPRIHTFTVNLDDPLSVRFDNTTLRGFPWRAVRGLPRYPYQVLMGSDDLLGPEFVSVARSALTPAPRAIATFMPIMLNWGSGRIYEMKPWRRPSPFVVMKQPLNDPRYTWVWAEDHRKLGRLIPRVIHVPAGHVAMTVHGHNDGTGMKGAKGELPRSALAWL